MTDSSSPSSAPRVFTVQFDDRIPLTDEQIAAIEKALGAAVAEQLATFAIAATGQPLPELESVPLGGKRVTFGQFFGPPITD